MGIGAILFPHLLCNWTQLGLQVIKTIHILFIQMNNTSTTVFRTMKLPKTLDTVYND